MAAFQKKYSSGADPGQWIKRVVITGSETVTVGGLVTMSSGTASAATAGVELLGVVQGIETKDGLPLYNATSGTDYDGTYSHTAGTYAAAADNATDKMVKVVVDCDPFGVWSNQPDATIGTDAQSDCLGCYTDIASATQVDEDTAVTTTAQLLILGVDPENSANGLYMMHECYMKTLST